TQKAESRRFITDIFFVDDFQSHGAAQIDVERLVGDAHCTTTQLDRFLVFARYQLIVVKSLRRLVRYWVESSPSRRLAGINPTDKTFTKHTDRTKMHCS